MSIVWTSRDAQCAKDIRNSVIRELRKHTRHPKAISRVPAINTVPARIDLATGKHTFVTAEHKAPRALG